MALSSPEMSDMIYRRWAMVHLNIKPGFAKQLRSIHELDESSLLLGFKDWLVRHKISLHYDESTLSKVLRFQSEEAMSIFLLKEPWTEVQ